MRLNCRSRDAASPPSGSSSTRRFFFRRKHGVSLFLEARREDAFDKELRHLFGRRPVHRAIERENSAKGGNGVARQRLAVRIEQRILLGRAAGVGVLDDDRRRNGKLPRQAARRFQVHKIVVGKLLALNLPRAGEAFGVAPRGNIERRGLMRVFPVPQRLQAHE